jgi:multiple sugar transport system ATP-binding protein
MADVALEGVSKHYPNGVTALSDLTLHVGNGELLALLGPSGCGKTTTLRLIAGLETPTRGLVRIAGRMVNAVPPHQRQVALVFQRPALYPFLTVAANLAFGLELGRSGFGAWIAGRADRAEIETRVAATARLLRIDRLLDRRPLGLSGGEQQRVALGRALVRRPEALLLDEPLASLDAPLRLEMRRELHLLQRQIRATMIYVSHDQEEALTLGDRVAVLWQGRLQQVDTPANLLARPSNRLVAGFVGSPPINLLDGRLTDSGGRLTLTANGDTWIVPEPLAQRWQAYRGQSVTVGSRPEQLRLAQPDRDNGLTLTVVRVERMGPGTLVTLMGKCWQARAWLPGTVSVAEQSRLAVDWEVHQTLLFDGTTGQALDSSRPEEG